MSRGKYEPTARIRMLSWAVGVEKMLRCGWETIQSVPERQIGRSRSVQRLPFLFMRRFI